MRKYIKIFTLSFAHGLKNYKSLIGLSIFLMTCLVIFDHLWKIAAAKTGALDLNPQHLLWYIAFNEWVLVSIPDIQDEMEYDLRSGRLAYLLPRPVSYLGAAFAEAFGILCLNLLVLGVATFSFVWMQTGELPFHPAGFIISLLFGLAAGIVGLIFHMLIGLSGFWLHEVSPCFWIWEKLLFMLGGLMLPLAAYPQWMQTLARLTPFPMILGDRSALALNFNGYDILVVALSLAGWGICGLVCSLTLYRKGLKILNIEG